MNTKMNLNIHLGAAAQLRGHDWILRSKKTDGRRGDHVGWTDWNVLFFYPPIYPRIIFLYSTLSTAYPFPHFNRESQFLVAIYATITPHLPRNKSLSSSQAQCVAAVPVVLRA